MRLKPWTLDEIFAKSTPEPNTGCWLWLRSVDSGGYARTQTPQEGLVHRISFKLTNPNVDLTGKHVHHKCKMTCCVNPDHLAAVTPAEHVIMDGLGGDFGFHSSKTHCPSGHPYDGDNLVAIKHRRGNTSRQCRTCRKAAMKRWYVKRKSNPTTKEV